MNLSEHSAEDFQRGVEGARSAGPGDSVELVLAAHGQVSALGQALAK